MLEIRRIKTDRFRTAAFWIEKRDNEYIACRTLVNALLRIASPSIMSVGQEALKSIRNTANLKGAIQTMKDNYERLRKEYLNICDEDCGGDPSTGIQPCPFFEYEEGCLLKSEKFRAAPGGLNNLAAAVHENAVAHGW